jgi:hypothetical protein
MKRRLRLRRWVALAMALALIPAATAAAPQTSSEHCVTMVQPMRPGEHPAPAASVRCFARFDNAIAYATGGAVRIDAQHSRALEPKELAVTSSTTVIGVDYRDSGFSGSTLTTTTSHTPGCTDGTSFGSSSMPGGWNDVVSSAIGYQGCNSFRHYEHTSFGGALYTCTCSSMSIMNDRTSSEQWSQ